MADVEFSSQCSECQNLNKAQWKERSKYDFDIQMPYWYTNDRLECMREATVSSLLTIDSIILLRRNLLSGKYFNKLLTLIITNTYF